MLNSRDKWAFVTHPSKPPLEAEDVQYWKKILQKLLKVGLEFEFNLPDKNGNCKGDSTSCPCKGLVEDNCWRQCTNQEACDQEKKIDTCSMTTDKCTKDKCVECEDYKFKCLGLQCNNFESACYTCGLFSVNCGGCKHKFDPKRNPGAIRERCSETLEPNNSYGTINASGVHSIVTDGSLQGGEGMEVVTIGRRPDYWEFYKMSKKIIDEAVENGAFINERCSIHMHVLASYYGKLFNGQENESIPSKVSELERPLPQVVLANLHQLVRRYQNAMTWMMMGLDNPKKMTRWEKFRVSVLDITPVPESMPRVIDTVKNTAGGKKYGWINYNYVEFNKANDVTRLHVEFRALDGILSPSAVAALACMYYALTIKAVEISRYGLVEVGDKAWLKQAKTVKNAVLNNMKGYDAKDRWGDTRNTLKYEDILVRESLELVHQLKHILIETGPCYPILESLAERPVAIRRCNGQSWKEIEDNLAIPVAQEDMMINRLVEYIDLRIISQCKDVREWIDEVAKAMVIEDQVIGNEDLLKETMAQYISDKTRDGFLIWSDSLGSVVKL